MWNDDDRKWLYEQMRKNGVNTGSYDDFTKSLDNKEDRDWYYQKSRSLGLNVGSADDFASMMVQPVQKPAPAQPVVKQTTGQVNPTVNTSTQPKQDEQPQKQGGWQPTWQEKMGMQMQLDETMRQVKQSQQDFNTRMENIRKGNTLGKTSEVKFNPESGKMERRYYTTHGDEVTTPLEQSRLNLKYRDEWEATTPEGRKHREKRIENDFERRVGASLDKYDPDNAAAMVWQQAEDKSNEEFGRYLDERSKPSWSNFLRGAAEGTSVTGGLGADNVDTGIKAFATHLKYHDLQRMADDAWNMLGKEKQQSIIEDMYGALKNRYPQATEQQLQQAATEMAREQSDRRMYELAVAKNAPKDAAEYFIRKVAAGNAMGTLMQAAARAQAGTTGDWEAREDAEQRFEKQGHKVAGIAGTVTGFALDPLTWASAGAGGAAVKGTTWLGGKMIGEAAMRKFGTTLGGRMLGGAIGGAVNFGTYEAGSEALDQMKWGGYIDEETGERKDGFSFGNVAGRAGHGLMMGAVTGVIAPYLGNVSDKLVRATESTVGKMGIRAGELGVGTVAEGTIFAVPEIIDTYGQYGDLINSLSDETSPNYIADEQERAAKIEELRNSRGDALMDVWTDNMAMIAGFKAQHLLKSAPRVIYDLARSKNGKAGFETRLRSILDGRGDLALTEDEKKELERRGYGDLKDLTEEYSRYAEAKEEYDKARPTTTDASRMIEGGDGQAELPYNRFVELMTDNSVSEAARAKMYYYLTGHGLPMSTVMGSTILEDKDADGNVTGYTVQSFGANGVITSRSFGDKKRADVEANRINRQAELNGFDVGERYYDWQGDNKRMYEACESVAEETGAPANLLFDLMKRKTEAMNEVELEWAEKILNAYNGLGDKYGSSEVRTAINEEFGVDVDKAIRKERNRRSEQEQKAVDEYASRLFADVKRKQEEAAERGEAPVDPDAPTSNSQIAALLGIDDGEQGDPVSAAFNRGHEADAQERQDIAIELADPNNAEAQEAWNGVVQRINEDAAYMVAQQREQTKQMQHTDGSLRPAILKEKDSEGNDQQVYIVDGNVQMMPDGSMVDKASSDNIVVVYNPATGERKQIDPSADTGISSLGEVTTAEQREADIERSRQEYIQAQIDEAQGTVRFVPGQQLVLPTGEEAVVVATDADGENITVALGDGTQATVQRSELQRIRDEKASADYRQRHGITEEPATQQPEASAQPQTDGRVAGAPADYTADMELTIRDEDGSEKPAMVMGRVRYENGSFVPDANGNIIEYFMDGEVKHDHEDKLVDKVVSHVAPQQPEAAPVQEASAETPATVETTPPPVEQPTEVAPQQVQEPVQTVEPQPAQPAEAPAQPTEQPTAEPMPVGEDGEEDWQATTPERAHAYIFNEAGLSRSEGNEFIAAQTQAAQSALVKAKSAQMPRVGTSIKKYNDAKAKRQEKIDEAQRVLDYWQQVRNIQNDIQRVENERRAAEDAVRHDEAVAEAQAEYEARKQAEAERKAVGNENPMPAITEKWNNATKVDGHRDEIMLPDGTPLKGHYVLHESGASSPSHNPETWQKTDGFPMDANDNSVNDRDYERDHDAQEHTQSIARQYDQRALQSVPVVSNDGVVLSGNGRTMAGELAARDNTDGAYVNYLKEYAPKFGFTPEQVEAMQHPRVSFVPDEAMPYTAETFAKFNQQEMKSQNKTEQAVKLGKTVNDDSFKGIVRTINGYDTLGDFYNDAEASLGAVYDLHNAGVVPQAQLAEMVDGVRGQEKLSAVGREFLENMLIGKAFEGDPEVVRMLTAEPAMRQTVITALGEIVDNIALGGDWSLQGELADAVKLCFDARQGGAKYGEIVSTYARQGVLFADPDELQTVADFNNATMLMLADVLNDKRVTLLKTTLQLYNNNARQSAVGQADLFAGGIQSREDILRDVITFINENYGKRKEIEAARAEAVERRKAESVQQDGTPPTVSTDGEATAEPSAEPAPVEAEPVEATEPVEAEPNAVQTALAAAEQETNTEPTEAQKEAGNYKKGHVKIDGYDVTIENPKGSVRRGTDASGKQWEQEMQNTYGYIRGTEGVDGDHIDVFFSEDPSQGDVFVVDQVNKDGSFDEHKVMYGFPDIESARKAYLSNYEDGWQGLGAITPVSKEEFKKWIDSSHRKTKPFADYSSVKPLGDTQLGEQPTAGYSIEPTTYTNKKGKTTPMHLVTFGRELSKDEIRAGKELAKESRGWWDREKGGFMMRDEDSAKALAEALSNEEAVQDAQPLSVEDVATVTDQADMKAVDETIKVEQEPQTTPQYDYDREDDVYDKTLTGLRNVLNDRKRGAIPNIKSIENVIRDLRKRAKTIEDGMATAAGETIPQAFDALANLNGRRKAYEQFLVDIRRKMAETERDDALAAHGVKLGDKIMYKGKEVTIHDADARQVTLDVGLAPVMYEVTDWENVEVPKREPATPQPKKVNVESLMGELNEKGEAKLSDHTEEQQQEESTEQPKQEEKKAKSKWVDDADAERFEELRRRLRQKLGGQLNMGVDPEAFALGVEMSYLMLKHGARKFAEFAKQMIEALGENVRPYLKSFYNGARDLPEMAEYEKELTPYDEVRTFDVMNFDKEGAKDIVATAEHIVREQAAEREAKEATDKLKQERNEQRKETEQEVAANTEALASEAATVASEVESKLPSARSEREVNDLAKSIDDAIDKVNDQLALLGYYEAEPVESDFNEAYGYMRNAEKKAVKNVTELFKTLTKELGISDPVVYDTKGKKQKSVTANIAPAGGDVTMRFMLNRDKGVELYIDFMLEPDYENNRDNLVLKGIMFRPEKNQPNGGRDYLRANNFFPVDVTVPQMLQGIRSVCQEWLPAEDYVAMAQRVAAENAGNQKEKTSKGSKSKKKSVSLQQQTIPDLFSGLFSEDNLKNESNDTARTRQAENGSREDGTVGRVPAGRDRVLDTNGTEQTDNGRTASVSDTSGSVVDATRTGIPGQRSSRSATRGNNVAGETERGLSDGGRSISDGTVTDGGNEDRGTSDATVSVQSRAGEADRGGKRGLAQHGGRGNVKRPKQTEPKFKRNYIYPENSSEIDNMTPQQRLTANVEALEVVRTLMKEGREATPEEREILGKYRGWGGVELGRAYSTDMMRRSFTDRWGAPTEQGKLLGRLADVIDELDPKGERGVLSAINRAALTSYYTPTGIAKVMNRFAELAGFKGGSMLDPSMGNGVFEGTMSKGVQQRTMIHGIELDWLTGQIARNLYPDANVLVTGYEQAGTADNAYDVVMSNIPFGSISVTDKTWKHDSSPVRKAAQGKIHNYFAVKMLDNTRPGGLCVIMTSNAILDTKGNQIIREHLADQAEVLGVVRLPDNTFKGAGTSVVTDVIFLRKYKDDADRAAIRGNEDYTANIEKPFLSSGELQLTNPTDGKTYKVTVNGYFTKNKGMMIGDAKAGGQYRADEFGLGSSLGTDELAKAMSKIVEKKIVGDRKGKLFDTHKTEREVHQAVSEAYKGDGNFISSGNIVEQDGMFGIVTSNKNKYGDVTSTFNEMPSLKAKASRIRAMLPIREAMKELIAAEIGGTKEDVLKELRKKLQGAYDAYVKKFGHLNNKENDFLIEDIDGYTLRSLERWKDGKFDGLSDIFTKNTIKPALDLSTAKTPADAISLSLAEYGEINPSFMEDVLGESWAEQCGETLFRTPFTEDVFETADAYLSGDVKTKLEQAREAAKQDKSFERNVEALEAVQPKDIPFEDISIRMGARWIPAEVYTDFMFDMFGIRKNDWKGNKSGVEYMPEVDQYVVNVANNELGGEADAWRTSRRAASEVFTAALQDKSLSVFDTIKEDGKEIKVLNKEETELLNNKIQDLRTEFEDWLSQNPEREEMLMRLYNDKFNRTVLRKFDGSHLNVAGLMGKELRPHQKDAVWMLINNRGGIVDHIVGAGKTLVMQSAIMEMRRMGIAKKPMIIGLKATVAQIAKEFREAYPAARILAPTEKDFSKENRKRFMSQIALNDYDCVILSHDQYCMLPHTEEVERGVIDEQMMQLDAAIEYLYGQSDKNQLTKKQIKGLEKRKANLEAKLDKLLDRKIDREFTFEGLGVDYLFVDECQHFKSLPYVSTYDRVAGLGDKQGSQRAIALLNGVRYLQRMHQGDRGTVFLSGTTISNSLSEIYHLLNYLRPSEMERLGMTTFDAWAGNYAIHTAELEYGVTNELKEKDRFRSLTNIPELSKMYAEIADVRNDLNLKLPKPKMRSHVVTVPQSDIMQEINREIVNMVKNKDGSYFGIDSKDTTPWGLLASTLSAKAAINPRLIDDTLDDEGGKIPAVCENVKKIYDQFKEQKGTQLIFCDTGVPGKGKKYDAYSDIINRLVNDYGIPRKEIADIHEAGTDEKRKELFAKVNDGSVRILIGGTKNMGTGVNVQKRIVAMHHVDVPWTPADREQREGRGVRQGNEIARDFNDDNVDVYFYATEGSLDMYKYQLQETKGKLFAQFKSGTIGDRTFDEGDAEGDFDPAEVVAMLSGNPVIFEKSKQDKKVEKLRRAKRAYESDWQRRRSRYEELQQKKRNFERLLSLNASDVRDLERGGFTPDEEGKYPTTVTVSVKDDYSSRRTFDKPKEAGEYIHSLLKQGKKVQLTGFNQKANITVPITDAGLFGKPVAELDSYGGIKYTVEVSDDDTAAGVAFRNLLQKVYSNRKVYERNLEDVNNQLKGADPGENKFPKQAELDEALKEKKRLDDEYKKLSDEEPKADENKDGGLRFRDGEYDDDIEQDSTMQEDRDMMRSAVQQMGEKLHTDINIIEDVNEITHPNAAVQERRRKSKGWYDTATGQVNIVLDNNKNIDDVKASVGHETIAHKGLRELVGEEYYDEFLDETYQHLRDDLKKGVDDAAGRAFIDDTTKNGKRAKSYEQHRRTAVDELFGRMAEKPFEEFSEGERTLWQKIKATVRRLLDKFLGSLKLPKWFELGDNELRYILWRSKERLERGKEHPIDLARDIVKREELGLTDEARYNMGDAPETFKARQRRAVENRGTVMPGLNGAKFKVVEVPRHQYQGRDVLTQARDAAIDRYSSFGDGKKRELKSLHYDNLGTTFDYVISPKSLTEAANHASDSDNIGVHAAVMDKLDEVINESVEIEEHPDIKKKDGERKWENGFNKGILMHRFAAAVRIGDEIYRVKTTMKEYENPQKANGHYTYEVTKIEVLDEQSNTPNGRSNVSDVFVSGAKLLNNLEKSYDSGKKILDESKIADESTDLYRDPDETEDIWNDQSLGLQERITAAATRLANNHRDNKTLRNDAMRAIGGNLSDLRKAMSLQRTFDMTTVKRVADLARVLMNNGYLNGLTQQEVKRLLAAVKNSVGHNDIEGDVQKVMDIMVDNQLKHAEDTLHELEAIRGSKVDARGVEVQGQLDPAGAHTMKVFKKTRGWEKTDIEEAISEAQQRMGSSDVAVADEAALEYTGLQLAQEYAENIKDSKVEERKLREEIKQAHDDASERDRATDSYRQYIASLQEAIRQNKIERAQSYFDLVGRLSDSLRESIANAKDFKEAEKQRIREIQHNANSDMEGRASDEHLRRTHGTLKALNNIFSNTLFAPLATFDQMLRMFGGKSANGEGYLYNRFMRGWIDARQQEINGVRDKYAILDAKAAELFGGKVKTWGDLIRRVGKLPKGTVSFWNGGEMQERELTQGNLMYIYMVNKMLDGRMKLRKMGITEENVADIEEVLDPRLIELADWLQDEFLVQTRNEYNETHKRMFGASMAAIEHYFPLKILANARADKPEDLDNPDKSDGISTATGSIIKRRRNALALDITGADALSVILDHVAQMEHWNAFAEFNRDINTLRTYKRFRNQVQNMTTIYGNGEELWKKFNDVCQMAAGTYRPPRTKLDKGALEFAQGVTAAKVSFRMFTALKQLASMPAYIPEVRADYLAANILNPAKAWKWSMEHLPIFSERWRSRVSGDPRLAKSGMDWRDWRANLVQRAARWGMSPNAFVDALTVSIGAHSMYQTRLAQYLRDGYSEADAEKKAVQDAEVLYNQTQQSSEGAFTSTMQVDRSWLSVLFTVFRNASMSYQRQLHDAFRNFKHNLTPGGRARSIEFMKKQYVRDGIDEAQAEQNAKRKFRRQLLKDTLRVATFGYIMQWAWNMFAYLPYLLFGDDEDEKQKMWDDVWAHTAFGSVEGLTGGDLMSQAGQMMLTGEGNPAYLSKDMPLTSDIMAAFQKLGNGQHTEALNDMINLIVQAGLGVNPQSITDVALSIMDACGDDPALAHEATICISRILQVPQSQIDKMYFDEVGLSGDEVSKYTPAQLAERYAQFKVKRGRFFSPWSWGDEERIKKFTDKANKTMKERTEQMGDDKVNEAYLQYEEVYKGVDAKVKAANKAGKTDYVKQAEMLDVVFADKDYETYETFKTLDKGLNDIVKKYLGSQSENEASLCRKSIVDYKKAMVGVLEAKDEKQSEQAWKKLDELSESFENQYWEIHDAATQ